MQDWHTIRYVSPNKLKNSGEYLQYQLHLSDVIDMMVQAPQYTQIHTYRERMYVYLTM